MRQIWITRAGRPEVLEVREAPDPDAGAGEVRIRVRAAGVNFADLMARVGLYPDAPPLPCVVGYEVAGVVDQVGAGCDGLSVGDRAIALPKFGGYTDTLVVPAAQVSRMPDEMSFEEGAALQVAYLTAHHAMLFTGNLRPGSRVLIHSAAGAVGLAAVDLARTRDCEIFGTASPGKHEFLRARGVAHPIDSRRPITSQVRAALAGAEGLDLVLDPMGGRSFTEGYALLGRAGRLVCFGLSTAAGGETRSLLRAARGVLGTRKWSPLQLLTDNKQIAGVGMGQLFDRLDLLRPQIAALLDLFRDGRIRPHVGRAFRFDEAPAAHRFIHERKSIGKVLLLP
jgi:NADPH:quinone reductase-like Zn-dependent oxidoreductase